MRGEVDLGLNSPATTIGSFECSDLQVFQETILDFLLKLDSNQLRGLEQVVSEFERLLITPKKDQLFVSLDQVPRSNIIINFISI